MSSPHLYLMSSDIPIQPLLIFLKQNQPHTATPHQYYINLHFTSCHFSTSPAMASGCPLDHLFNRNHEYMLKYKCLQCGQRHGTKKEARKHAVTHDQSLQTLLDQWLKNRGRCHVCNRCGREFKSEQIWTIHQKHCGGVLHSGVGITTIKNRLKTSI